MKTMKLLFMGTISTFLTFACTDEETTRIVETRTAEEENEEGLGISFGMESDSLEEDVEEVWFGTKEWDEEDLGVDL